MIHSLGTQGTLLIHKKKIKENKFLNRIYHDFYNEFKSVSLPLGQMVELGSGGGFLKEILPQVITSDVMAGPGIDSVFSASEMPFVSQSIAGFFLLDVFHHIRDTEKALVEIERCLKPGGKIIMIEPYNSRWSRFIYKNFHHEVFDDKAGWMKSEEKLFEENGAVPWIVFVRDKKLFEKKFPNLKILQIIPHTPWRYLFSGGLSHPQLIPTFFYPFIKLLETLMRPFNRFLGMFVTIVIEKEI